MRTKRSTALSLFVFLQVALFCAASPVAYQLCGTLKAGSESAFRNHKVDVILQCTSAPFAVRTLADAAGKFRFKNLPSGTYILIAVHERLGELRKTVEIGPSFADASGKILATVSWEAKPVEHKRLTISAAMLSVSDGARKLYASALDLLGRHDVAGATQKLEKAVQAAPKFVAAWSYLGSIAYQSRQFAQAEQCFREAYRLDPVSNLTLANMGGVLLSEGKLEEALPFNLEAVQAAPNDALAHSQLGLNFFRLGNDSEAETQLKEAKKSDPSHYSFPQLTLSSIYKGRGDYSRMIRELEEFLQLHPDSDLVEAVRVTLASARHARNAISLSKN